MSCKLRPSWLTVVWFSWLLRPVQEPPVPGRMVPGLFDEPMIVKSAARHLPGPNSAAFEVSTAAETEVTVTALALELVKVPESGWAVPPGKRLPTVLVWLTVMPTTVPVVAVPTPVPPMVQKE